MKKLLALTLSLVAVGFSASTGAAKPAAEVASPATTVATGAAQQWRDRRGRGRIYNRRIVRTVTQTRLVRSGRRLFRETYQVTYLPNGRTQTRLVSRVRVR